MAAKKTQITDAKRGRDVPFSHRFGSPSRERQSVRRGPTEPPSP